LTMVTDYVTYRAPCSFEGRVPDAILKAEQGRFPRAVSQTAPGRTRAFDSATFLLMATDGFLFGIRFIC